MEIEGRVSPHPRTIATCRDARRWIEGVSSHSRTTDLIGRCTVFKTKEKNRILRYMVSVLLLMALALALTACWAGDSGDPAGTNPASEPVSDQGDDPGEEASDTGETETTQAPAEAAPEITEGGKRIAAEAEDLAWPYGTEESLILYDGGEATEAFKEALETAYPDRSRWGRMPRRGASCDVFVGTVIRACGYDEEFPRGLDEVEDHIKGHASLWETYDNPSSPLPLLAGDVIFRRQEVDGELYGHILIYLGDGMIAQAQYGQAGRYGHICPGEGDFLMATGYGEGQKVSVYRAKE